MSEPVKRIQIKEIECRGLRSADLLTSNDVYVVFKAGSKEAKTKYISGGGKNVKFKDVLEMYVSDAELQAGIDFTAYDYDVGPDPDDLLGVGKLTHLVDLKQCVGVPRQFDTHLMYKGKQRGQATCIVTLTYPGGDGPQQQPVSHGGAQAFDHATMMQQQPHVAQPVTAAQPVVVQHQQPQQQYMTVTCPATAYSGLQVIVQAPNGTRLQVVIPAGVGPGQQFRVPLPAAAQQPQTAHVAPAYHQPQPVGVPTAFGTAVDIDGDGRPDYVIPHQQHPYAPPPPY